MGLNGGDGRGSAVQLAALALGRIEQFTSATGRGASPQPPKGLTLANNGTATANSTYGGDFASGCPTDYFGTAPSPPAFPAASASNRTIDPTNDAAGHLPPGVTKLRYNSSRGLTLEVSSPATARLSGTKTLCVDGNVYINSSIEYNAGPWAIGNIPKFTLVVKGNIYIDSGVAKLDGIYVAQPLAGGTKGHIVQTGNHTSNRIYYETGVDIEKVEA